MECQETMVSCLSWLLLLSAVAFLREQTRTRVAYGRYWLPGDRCCPARLGWFLQELPSFLVPLLLLLLVPRADGPDGGYRILLLGAFMFHYFHRSFVFGYLTRGRPIPLYIVLYAAIFCSFNGFLQGHHLLHCAPQSTPTWLTGPRRAAGFLLFVLGMIINIHSDHILRNLRKPGETVYRIPQGGMFRFVSGANFFGEIVEWCGFALAAWSLPAFAFAFFTICSIGPRAYHHHRYYQKRFEDYPSSRKAVIPFIL
ncbi:3-oxo-5-alpha-steroid 4-dehydrogenase 2-like [Nelusetta ayraudi]|uniref:3-oxo-5-alpha-steroid 4-dehydrogenase 2-like n=1 Tax=Nelusetta ayraudi TaxID=303726 RepID=UPI003F730AF1